MRKSFLKKTVIYTLLLLMTLQSATPAAYATKKEIGDITVESEASKEVETEIIPDETAIDDPVTEMEASEEVKEEEVEEEMEETIQESTSKNFQYTTLMRRARDLDPAGEKSRQPMVTSPFHPGVEKERIEAKKNSLKKDIDQFIQNEKVRLNELGVSTQKQETYFKRLRGQKEKLFLKGEELNVEIEKRNQEKKEIKIPKTPSEFKFENENIPMKKMGIQVIEPSKLKVRKPSILEAAIPAIATIPRAHAAIPYTDLPILADVQADDGEIQINSEIRNLANSLNNNPVEIYNFVRNHITYEPYFGAKKGAIGCLREAVCNDHDTASLTIALLRASGIPARYKKSIVVMPVEQLQELLGVEETKTVYAAFAWNKVPVYLTGGNSVSGETLETYDFTNETELALEWVFVEAFYDYDERGANYPNDLSFAESQTDDDVRTILQTYPAKQWIPIDAVVKPYIHTQNEIIHDTAGFDTNAFWNGYFQYNGTQNPLEKYAADLQAATGKDINDSQYQSTIEGEQKEFDILPPYTPYQLAIGVFDGGEIVPEMWAALPDARRAKVQISLKKESDLSTVLSQSFYGVDINNVPLNLYYKGATLIDENVIESYGGIHATPADLVDIVPYFSGDYSHYDGTGEGGGGAAVPIEIGDSLVLEFEYFVNGESIHTSQKFSVAGNSEGIYVTLSKILSDTFLDDETDPDQNSKILLEGNAEIARQYLRRVEQNSEKLKKALDISNNIQFNRAVVTQNRVLTEVGGTPTTFDFKGLTIDATSYLISYSNRNDLATHRQDFHLLWGLQASYEEADIFEDITGLEAISTVQGLQYANANPGDYTIHTITSGNESIIDSLNLSANTKANMHADVQEGNTIITPDKSVTEGTFTGIFYISLDSDGTALYAIGEQSQGNGAWMVVLFNDVEIGTFFDENADDEYFIFAEDILGNDRKCRILKTDFVDIANNPGYDGFLYGYPCFKETKDFGKVNHTYLLLTKGVKFHSEGLYEYWKTMEDIKSVLRDDKNKDNYMGLSGITLPEKEGKFKFNSIAGTYSWFGKYDDGSLTAYYEPNSDEGDRGYGRIVYGDILDKLVETRYDGTTLYCNVDDSIYCNKLQWVIATLGYPIMNISEAARSLSDVRESSFYLSYVEKGKYQRFIGGDIYDYDKIKIWTGAIGTPSFDTIHSTFYVPNEIMRYYDKEDNCFMSYNDDTHDYDLETCGSGGRFGFPVADPVLDLNTNKIYQEFEAGNIEYDINTSSHVESELTKFARWTKNKMFALLKRKEVMEGKITDVEAFAEIIKSIALNANSDDIFMKDLLMVTVGTESLTLSGIKSFFEKQNLNPYDGSYEWKKFRVLKGFSDTGFLFDYNDSHYCMQNKDNNGDYICTSNQLFHAMGGFNGAYIYGEMIADFFTNKHDDDLSALGYGGKSKEDRRLGYKMSKIGKKLKDDTIDRYDVAETILNENDGIDDNVFETETYNMIVMNSEFKKKFRIYEYEQHGDNLQMSLYNQDMGIMYCGAFELYYQDYDYFNKDNTYFVGPKVVWNETDDKMLFIPWHIHQDDMDRICNDITSLTNTYGEDLHLTFKQMITRLEEGKKDKPTF